MISQKKIITNLLKQNKIKYYNLFNNVNFNDEDFADYDHLNERGVEKINTILNDDKQLIYN